MRFPTSKSMFVNYWALRKWKCSKIWSSLFLVQEWGW